MLRYNFEIARLPAAAKDNIEILIEPKILMKVKSLFYTFLYLTVFCSSCSSQNKNAESILKNLDTIENHGLTADLEYEIS